MTRDKQTPGQKALSSFNGKHRAVFSQRKHRRSIDHNINSVHYWYVDLSKSTPVPRCVSPIVWVNGFPVRIPQAAE